MKQIARIIKKYLYIVSYIASYIIKSSNFIIFILENFNLPDSILISFN